MQKVQDLRLHRDVERARRLVEHDQLRVQRQRAGDRDALALPAGELVGIAVEVLPAHADLLEQLDDALGQLGAGRLAIDPQRPADDVLDEVARIERGEGILEDDLAVAAESPPGRPADPVDAVERLQLGEPRALVFAPLRFRDGEDAVETVALRLRRGRNRRPRRSDRSSR